MHLNSTSPALAPMPATDQILTCPLVEPHWGQHNFLWLTSTEARLFISDVCPFSGTEWVMEWHIHLTAIGQRDCPRWNQINTCLLLHPGFSSWCWLSRTQSPSSQEAGKYPNVRFMLQWMSWMPSTISSPGYFPIAYSSHITFCHIFLAHISPCYNSYSCTSTYATRLPLSCRVSDFQIFPFQAEISQARTETRVGFDVAVAIFVARKISV